MALAPQLLAALDAHRRRIYGTVVDLEALLRAHLAEARAAWPALVLADEAFLTYLAARLPDTADPAGALAGLHAADLYLTCGCAAGDARAIAAFEARFAGEIGRAARRVREVPLPPDELRQALREKLFVPRARRGAGVLAPGKIADYAGQGHLENWVRVTALRLFIDLARRARGQGRESGLDSDELLRIPDGNKDLALSFLERHYRGAFKMAFEHAVASLDASSRNLLRHAYVHGLTVDQIAAAYGVHRATAARRVSRAREALLAATRDHLTARLRIGDPELDSILALIRSNLSVSLERVLGPAEAHP